MRKIIILLLAILGLTNNLLAYPISPRPLRKLIMESEYIISGYVVKTYSKDKEKDSWGNRVAQIAILETLQGKIKRDTIEVEFVPGMICPAPARYQDSTYVLAFLDYEDGAFTTHALSYGSKTLSKEEISIYKMRILEMQQILKITNKATKFQETVEWLVKCAENETTRYEGSFELSPESNFMSYYSRDEKPDDYKIVLSQEQKDRLRKSLLYCKDVPDFGIVDLVYKGNEVEMEMFLINKLKALSKEHYWVADDFMDRLKHRNNTAQMTSTLQAYEKIRFDYDKESELKELIDKFIQLVE